MFSYMKRERAEAEANGAAKCIRSKSNAGPTPFHRRSSYLSLDAKLPRFKWLIYDNRGSFNGWFDWLPLWMRVGRWNPLVVAAIVSFYVAIVRCRPRPLDFSPFVLERLGGDDAAGSFAGMPRATVLDLIVFAWGGIVLVHAKFSLGSIGGLMISFTGWSWMLLTSRAGLEFGAWAADAARRDGLASKLATVGSSLRFVAVTNACVVCAVWNLVLLPIIYFKSVPPGERRRKFLRFNFGFTMTNIHILNFPLAFVNVLSGDRVRPFTTSDLWVAYLVVVLYSVLYYFVMDRLGLHFYPIFNPRTSLSVVSIAVVLGLYYFLFGKWNDYVSVHLDVH